MELRSSLPVVPDMTPTLVKLIDDEGPIWRVTYAGMVREHRQEWQALVFFYWAMALYETGSSAF